MIKTVILFVILAFIWVMIMANRSLKRQIRRNDQLIKGAGEKSGWGTQDCQCGMPRGKWKALAMNRPDNTVLLLCPECRNMWEEQMSVYGNKWRRVDPDYVRENYYLRDETGRKDVGI